MKKVLLMLLAVVSLQVNAQDFYFTPKLGLNIANMTNSDGVDSRIGLNVGFGVEKPITDVFALESGVFYSMQGAKSDGATLKLDYINVPVLAKYYVTSGFNVFAGPQLGINVKSEVGASGGGMSASVDMSDVVKTVDVALNVGVGYQFDMGLSLSASYSRGLIGAFKDGELFGEGIMVGDDNSNHSVFSINVGWRF